MYGFSLQIQLYDDMLFQIQGLISAPTLQTNTTFLIDADEESTIRNICNRYSIAVFGLTPFTNPPESVSKAYFRFIHEKKTYTLYTPFEKAKDVYNIFREAGFTITYINNFDRQLPDADVERVIEKLNSDYTLAHAPKDDKDKSYITQFTDIVVGRSDQELKEIKKLATKAIEEAETVLSRTSNNQSSVIMKIRNNTEELKRLRLGTNIIKIREQMSLVYSEMEKIELEYLEDQKENEVKVLEGSIVTYLDIVSEWEKYKKTMALQKAKADKGSAFNYYVLFGSIGLYQKLIGKEMREKFNNVVIILNGIYDIIVMFIMMTIIWLVLLQLFNTIAFKGSFFTSAFIDVGIMGICSAVLLKFKKPTLLNLAIIGPSCVVLYFLLHMFFYANFGL